MKFANCWAVLLLLLGMTLPALGEDSETVLRRENERIDLLLDWRPGRKHPQLPPRLTFEPEARPTVLEPPKERRSNSGQVRPGAGPAPDMTAFEPWIRAYNQAVSAAQARLFAGTIAAESQKWGVDPRLVLALVAAESAFQPRVVSPAGARGLGQLMPGTAAMLGVSDAFDPRQNLAGTVTYLARQLRRFGSARLALAAYNAGPGAVQRYGGVPPYRETQAYVSYVLKLYQELKSNKSATLVAERVSP